jgi:prepilin-type N-terminal cleavage/methylation domain-containing protein
MKATRKSGFTMIELLVVIAIIGILSAVLVPMVTGVMFTAKMKEMGGNGEKIVKAMALVANKDGSPYANYVWPSSNHDEDDTLSEGLSQMNKAFATTEAYFEEALLLKVTNVRERQKAMLKDVEVGWLVGDGMTKTDSNKLEPANCAWAIAQDMKGSYVKESAPVLISKNIKGDQLLNVKASDKDLKADKLLKDIKPFGMEGCVVVGMNGASRYMEGDEMTAGQLLGNGMTGSDSLSGCSKEGAPIKYLQSTSN